MKNKKTWIALIALVLVVGAMAAVWFLTRPEAQEGVKSFTVVVVHADGTEKTFEYQSEEEKLGPALEAEGLIVTGESAGMYNTVDGETADWNVDQSYWAFYIDGEYAMEGMDETPITDGTVYKLEYTVYN